ncbi:adenosylcobinamide kinase /adenosylcobinamide-phosphate guanylyltransferase [Umezawaea tangerina]|uniref:Adenosylcobinamide kinase n=1 Tax=Umezawaea tangerina TaxID=84725 RepID=A0A2T0SKW3_9PSEU|nr:adenosylcobinamide kinase /adenosylcobinamide-phosphate guanylyltransferase [Umezawaea tangerina]
MLGGARSGKSAHAEGLLTDPVVTYVATARRYDGDADWDRRIARHVERRPDTWTTVETQDLATLLGTAPAVPLLVDDLSTWLVNVLDDAGAWESDDTDAVDLACDGLVEAARAFRGRLVVVSAEVGLGVVPSTRSGRLFRDHLGRLNARLAEVCDEVLLLVAGIPLTLREAGGTGP